jgi:hypothetical protein
MNSCSLKALPAPRAELLICIKCHGIDVAHHLRSTFRDKSSPFILE